MRAPVISVLLLCTFIGAASCKKKAPPVDTPVPEDTAAAAAPSAPEPSTSTTATAAHAAPTGPAPCKMALKVGTLASSGGTTDPDLSSNSTSTLFFPCTGAGSARAQFGKHSFSGTADKTKVNLTATSTYKAFGCPWETTQTITGAPPALHYSYTEHVAAGCKSSARPSTISGPVSAL